MKNQKQRLKVFLCHGSEDEPLVRALYLRLIRDKVDAWLDQEKLLPGQDWRVEIPRAVRQADIVIICLSNASVTKEGKIQREIKLALDVAEEKPQGSIFIIPARLEECKVPEQMGHWHRVDLFKEDGYQKLMMALRARKKTITPSVSDQNEIAVPIQVQSGAVAPRPGIQKSNRKLPLIGLLALAVVVIAIVITITTVQTWTAAPTETPTIPIALADIEIEFKITTPRDTQNLPAYGLLTLQQNDQIRIEISVTNANDIPYPHDLEITYFIASGGIFYGNIAHYTAKQSNDIITVLIKDQTTGEITTRPLLITISTVQ